MTPPPTRKEGTGSTLSKKVETKRPTAPPCHFYLIGKCVKGTACPFAHEKRSIDYVPPSSVELNPAAPDFVFDDSTISMMLGEMKLDEPAQKEKVSYSDVLGTSGSRSSVCPIPVTADQAQNESMSFSPRRGISYAPCKKNELCIFAMTGKCKFGLLCRSIHGIQCPRCLKFCLHPDDLEQNEEHIQQCLEAPLASAMETDDEKKIECGICYEPVLSKPDPRFGLLNCEHAFCIQCIRMWRSKFTMEAENLRSCPLCRTVTYFVVPSSIWIVDPEEKDAIIDAYKKKLSVIPCKHYTHGINTCPFGTSCFYSHANPDGTIDKHHLRTLMDRNEKPNVYRETRLSDFIKFSNKK